MSLLRRAENLKTTALTDKHIELGAKMVEFAGFNMPVSYEGIKVEHLAVRSNVGIFDISHMGEFIVKGEKALPFIQNLTTNDTAKLVDGKAQYACLTNEKGTIIDDLLIYRIDEVSYMLVVNASNIEKDWKWITTHNPDNAEVHDISDKTTLLAVQGPNASAVLQKLTDFDLDSLKFYTFTKTTFNGVENVLISATGYTGSGGFEIYFENEHALPIWDALIDAGAAFDIKPIGLAARDTLRLEMGFCLYGNDIDDSTTPLEAGLNRFTKLNTEFIGRDLIAAQKETGINRKLVGFEMVERGIPRQHYTILDGHGKEIGNVTSGSQALSLNKAIGLGYVELPHASENTELSIVIRDKSVKARIVSLPFYKG